MPDETPPPPLPTPDPGPTPPKKPFVPPELIPRGSITDLLGDFSPNAAERVSVKIEIKWRGDS
jgi:hypothetical protein